jgi:hypothetical protein
MVDNQKKGWVLVKKVIALCLVLAFLGLGVVGCGGGSQPKPPGTSTAPKGP